VDWGVSYGTAEAELLPVTETLPRKKGRIWLRQNDVLFRGDDEGYAELPLGEPDTEWSVWEGTVLLHLGFNVRILNFGNWDLRILDPDVDGWGEQLSDRGVPRRALPAG
jgi:hypothetical protein